MISTVGFLKQRVAQLASLLLSIYLEVPENRVTYSFGLDTLRVHTFVRRSREALLNNLVL